MAQRATFEDIRVERRDGVGWLIVDRPHLRNAVRPHTLREIGDAIDELTADSEVRALVLAGAGKHFMAGAEFSFLEDLKTTPPAEVKANIYALFQGAARRLFNCPKPTLAAVNGTAVTVGCELALACDFRIVTPRTQLQESWIKLGLMPPLGGLFLLPRYLGLGRAAQMCLTGEPIDGEAALRTGLAAKMVAEEDLEASAQAFADQLKALAPLAYATIKDALHRGLSSSIENDWAANTSAQSVLLSTKDFLEGLESVTQKRPPRFTGR